MTIDCLLRFTDEPTAQATLPAYYGEDWRGDICIPDVQVYAVAADGSRQAFPGWYIVIALPAIDPTLRDLANGECRLIADREAAVRGDPNFILYLAQDIDPSSLAVCRVEPVFAGSDYPFAT